MRSQLEKCSGRFAYAPVTLIKGNTISIQDYLNFTTRLQVLLYFTLCLTQ